MSTVRVEVEPELLQWAIERSGRAESDFDRFPLTAWLERERVPTLRQLEDFAAASRTPIGALLLSEPPQTELPLADFRTVVDRTVGAPSAELIDIVFLAERRQQWMRQRRMDLQREPIDWVGSVSPGADVEQVAASILSFLSFEVADRPSGPLLNTRTALVEAMEAQDVLVMIAGYIGHTRRTFNVDEFRGFCLTDDRAPLVFANGRDSKAGQLFTLVHEFAHLLIGQSALDLPTPGSQEGSRVERWCNAVAAEVLVPRTHLRQAHNPSADLRDEVQRLHYLYRASGLVILSQLHTIHAIGWELYQQAAAEEREAALAAMDRQTDGGNYYNTAPHMIGQPLLRAVAEDVRNGRTTTTEAMSLLQVRSFSTFERLTADL